MDKQRKKQRFTRCLGVVPTGSTAGLRRARTERYAAACRLGSNKIFAEKADWMMQLCYCTLQWTN